MAAAAEIKWADVADWDEDRTLTTLGRDDLTLKPPAFSSESPFAQPETFVRMSSTRGFVQGSRRSFQSLKVGAHPRSGAAVYGRFGSETEKTQCLRAEVAEASYSRP